MFRFLLSSTVPLLVSFAMILAPTQPSFAAGGDCRWEGGIGAQDNDSDGYFEVNTACLLEDCIGDGGLAECTAPKLTYEPIVDSSTDGEGWNYKICLADQGAETPTAAIYCNGNGGVWDPGSTSCDESGFPAGLTGTTAITESVVNSATDSYIDEKFQCAATLSGDSGWNTAPSSQCSPTTQTFSNPGNVLIKDHKTRTYNNCPPATNSNTVSISRSRQVQEVPICRAGKLRTDVPSGDDWCVIQPPRQGTNASGDEICTDVGDPCNIVTGAVWHKRTDYLGPHGLKFERHYRSDLYSPSDRTSYLASTNRHMGPKFTHNFEARIHFEKIENTLPQDYNPIGLYRPDGTYVSLIRLGPGTGNVSDVYVATDGSQIRLHKNGNGYLYFVYLPTGEVERYTTLNVSAGMLWKGVRLDTIYDASGKATKINYRYGNPNGLPPDAASGGIDNDIDGFWEIESVVGPFGHSLEFEYEPPATDCVAEDCVRRLSAIVLPDGVTRVEYCYESLDCVDPRGERLFSAVYEDADGSGENRENYFWGDPFGYPKLINEISGAASETASIYFHNPVTGLVLRNYVRGVQHTQFKEIDVDTVIGGNVASAYANVEYADGTLWAYDFQNADDRNPKIASKRIGTSSPDTTQLNETSGQFRLTELTTELGATRYEYDQDHLTSIKEGYVAGSPATFVRETRFTDYIDARSSQPETIIEPSVSGCAGAEKTTSVVYTSGGLFGYVPESITYAGKNPLTCATVSRTWQFLNYNSKGQPTRIDGPRDNTTDVPDITDITYWGDTTPTSPAPPACNPNGGFECGSVYQIIRRLGTGDHITTFDSYNADGLPTKITAPSGAEITMTWDKRQQLRSVASKDVSSNQSFGLVYTYYDNGQLNTVNLANGMTLTYTWDADEIDTVTDQKGNQVDYDYDTRGNVEGIDYKANGTVTSTVSIINDIRNRVDEITFGTSAGGAGLTNDFDFDTFGKLIRFEDRKGQSTHMSYDSIGRLTDIADRQAAPTNPNNSYDYDLHDNLIKFTSPNGAETEFLYDDLGNLVKEISADRGITIFEYDPAGNLVCRLDGRYTTTIATGCAGQPGAVTYQYDALNRITSVEYQADSSLNKTYSWDWFGKGEPTSFTYDNRSDYIWRDYDQLGRLIGQYDYIDNGTGSVEQLQTFYSFSGGQDRLRTITYHKPNGLTGINGPELTYKYDTAGKVVGLDLRYSGTTYTVIDGNDATPGVFYRPYGPVRQIKFGNGIQQNWEHDDAYRINKIRLKRGSSTIALWDYELDPNGNVLEIDRSGSDLQRPYVVNYTYDEMDRLETEIGGGANFAHSYDDNGNINNASLNFTYEPNSNLIDDSIATYEDGPSNPGGTGMGNLESFVGSPTTLFTFDAAGRTRVLSKNNQTATNLYNVLGERSYTYREYPNDPMTSADDEEFLDYYTYAEDGRVLSFVNTEVTGGVQGRRTVYYYIWLGQIPVGQLRVRFDSQGIEIPGDEQFIWIHGDHLYQPRLATGTSTSVPAGNDRVVWEYDGVYSLAYGYAFIAEDPDNDGASVEIALRFPGQVFYGFGAFSYNYYRDYDSISGRYIQSDPVGIDGGNNTYLYSLANPLRFTDPLGLAPNQQGAGDASAIYQRIRNLELAQNSSSTSEVLAALREPTYSELTNRYFYTDSYGWVDVKHFSAASQGAHILSTRGSLVAKGITQLAGIGYELFDLLRGSQSFMSTEDLPSNRAGADFGVFERKFCSGSSTPVADAFAVWLLKSGARRARDTRTGFDGLPLTEGSAPRNYQYEFSGFPVQ